MSDLGLGPLDRLFGDLFEPFGQQLRLSRQSWVPPVDIEETGEGYQVTAELPGMRPDDVEVTVEQNVLTISGERKWGEDAENRNFHRVERGYGRFVRSFALPQQVASERVQARFEDGVLHVTIPKAEGARPRRIQINEASPSGRSLVGGQGPRGTEVNVTGAGEKGETRRGRSSAKPVS
jgi:HSP20 family protein